VFSVLVILPRTLSLLHCYRSSGTGKPKSRGKTANRDVRGVTVLWRK